MKLRDIIPCVGVLLMLMSFGSLADSCPTMFYKGVEPTAKVDKVICKDYYAVGYVYSKKEAAYSVEHFTKEKQQEAYKVPRVNDFHNPTSIPDMYATKLAWYYHSGYDRGHLSPSADMPSREAMDQSFSLINMVPETPQMNRHAWEKVEATTRGLVMKYGEAYVVTGPVGTVGMLHGMIIPQAVFKAIYVPSNGKTWVYLTTNTNTPETTQISLQDLEKLVGFKIFPALEK